MALDSFSSAYKASAFGTSNIDLTDPNELLSLAQQQGGAVAQAANEIAHPTTGILSTIGDGFKKSFNGFVDIISAPSQAVAGVLSSKYTIREAMKKNISVSDVWFGKPDPRNSTLEKIGAFTVRTAVDILTDPLTYLTFGATGVGKAAIFGIGAIKKVELGEKAAAAAGGKIAKRFTDTGIAEAVLNKAGFDINRLANILIAQKSGKVVETKVLNEITGKVEKVLSREQVGILKEEVDLLVKASLDSDLNLDYASMAVSKLLEKAPQLTQEILDKGGIRWLGMTILESQRIYQTTQLIPGMSMLDHATQPLRNSLSLMFNPAAQRMADGSVQFAPSSFVELERSLKNLTETTSDQRMTTLWNMVKENRLSLDEAKMITVNMTANKPFADARLENVRQLLQGFSKDELNFLKDSGIPVTEVANYVPRVLTPEATTAMNKPSFGRGGLTQTVNSAKQAEVLRFTGKDTGTVKIGKYDKLSLKKVFTKDEEDRIISKVNAAVYSGEHDILQTQDEIQNLTKIADDFFNDKMSVQFKTLLDRLDVKDKENFTQLMNVMREEIGTLDIEKIASTYAKNRYVAGVKKPAEIAERLSSMSPEALAMLQERILNGMFKLKEDTDNVNNAIKLLLESPKKKSKVASKINPDDELKKLADDWKLGASSGTYKYVSENMDRQSLARVIDSMKRIFEENPTGIKRILDGIIGKKQAITDILANIDLEKTIAKNELSILPMEELFYIEKGTGEIYTAVQATIAEAKANGFDFEDNAILAFAAKSTQNTRAGFSYQFMNAAAHRYGVSKELAGNKWRTVNLSGIEKMGHRMDALLGKQFETRYFHPAVAQALENVVTLSITDPGSKGFLNAYDAVQNYWKASVTSIFPAFHGMNAISNSLQNFLDIGISALDPVVNSQSTAMIYWDRQAFNLERKAMKVGAEGIKAQDELNKILLKPLFTDSNGIKWTYGELRQVMRQKNIAFDPNHLTGQLDVTTELRREKLFDSQDSFLKKTFKEANVFSTDSRIFKTGRHVAQMVEEQARVTNFIANLKATGDPFLAAQRTKMFLFDYGNLTNFEKTFLKRIMPFYTFTRKNLELQARTLLSTPGRIEAELTAIQNLGEVISGGELTKEQKEALPDWMQSGMAILRKKRGSTLDIYSTLKTPIEQPFQQFQPNNFLGSISPLIRVPVEQISGYSLYNGKMLSDVTNAAAFKHAPQALKNFIGYTELTGHYKDGTPFKWYESLRPERMNLILNLPPTTRVFSSLKQMDNADVSADDKVLQMLTGIRPYSVDLQKEQAKRDKEIVDKLTHLLDSANVVATFSKTYIPKEQ